MVSYWLPSRPHWVRVSCYEVKNEVQKEKALNYENKIVHLVVIVCECSKVHVSET